MGRAARNHGGTGGHGRLPLPGERPDYHKHVMSDSILLKLVAYDKKKKQVEPKDVGFQLALASAKQPESTTKLLETSSKQPLNLKKSVTSTKLPVTSTKLPVTSTKQSLTSTNEKKKQVDPKDIGFAFASAKQPESSPKQLDTSCKQPLNSTKKSVTSTKQLVTSLKQSVSSPKEEVTSTKQLVTSSKQSLTSLNEVQKKSKVETNDIGFAFVSAKQPENSAKQIETSCKQPLNSTKKSVTPTKLSVTSIDQLVSSPKEADTSTKQTLTSPKQSLASPNECKKKKQVVPKDIVDQLTFCSAMQPERSTLQSKHEGPVTCTSSLEDGQVLPEGEGHQKQKVCYQKHLKVHK